MCMYVCMYVHTPTNALSYQSVPLTNLQSLQITIPLDFILVDQDSPLIYTPHMHTYIYTYTHTYIRTHIHTYTHTYIHASIRPSNHSRIHPSIQPLTHPSVHPTTHAPSPSIPSALGTFTFTDPYIHPSIGSSKHLIQWEILMRKSFVAGRSTVPSNCLSRRRFRKAQSKILKQCLQTLTSKEASGLRLRTLNVRNINLWPY